MKISVITVTNRYGGIDVAVNSLRKQTLQDFEWILVDELHDERADEVHKYLAQYKESFYYQHIKPRPKQEGHVWNLVNAYNDALALAQGELIVSLDDFTWIPANGLERWWEDYQTHGPALFTGVGNKAPYPDVTYPHGLISLFAQEYKQIPSGIVERDTRIDGRKEVVDTNHSFFELNWCAFPLAIAQELGGFDEEAQKQYGGQDRNFALRAELLGYHTFMDKANECIGLYHQGFVPRPADWEERHYNKNPRTTLDVIEGIRPVKLNYLSAKLPA